MPNDDVEIRRPKDQRPAPRPRKIAGELICDQLGDGGGDRDCRLVLLHRRGSLVFSKLVHSMNGQKRRVAQFNAHIETETYKCIKFATIAPQRHPFGLDRVT